MACKRFTNGFCIKTATNKYYSDIGRRLSEAYLPTAIARDTEDSMDRTFSMLTIDTRQRKWLKDKLQMPVPVSNRKEDTTVTALNIRRPPLLAKSDSISVRKTDNVQETFTCRKVSFRAKMAQVLFQKRHTCCRCKIRSRSCVRNKTFNGIEKHYTCCRCREAAKAVHNLFNGQSSFVQSGRTHSSLHSSSQENRKTVMADVGHKDSGYETVTSCSTVASSSSASIKPAGTNLGTNKPNGALGCVVKRDHNVRTTPNTVSTMSKPRGGVDDPFTRSGVLSKHEIIVSSYSDTNNDIIKSCADSKNEATHFCVFSSNDIKLSAPSSLCTSRMRLVDKTAQVSNVLVAGGQKCPFGVIRQVNQRRIHEYDGYLPETPTSKAFSHDSRNQIPPIATHLEASEQNGCFSEFNKLPVSPRNCRSENKTCYTCGATSAKVLFRLPREGGFVCEDCLDHLH
ncbi:hypothetical protein BsWGS_13402 [Bradybaena similaris]